MTSSKLDSTVFWVLHISGSLSGGFSGKTWTNLVITMVTLGGIKVRFLGKTSINSVSHWGVLGSNWSIGLLNVITLDLFVRVKVLWFSHLRNDFHSRLWICYWQFLIDRDFDWPWTIGSNMTITLTLVKFGNGAEFGKISFRGFVPIVSFIAFVLEVSLTWRGIGTRLKRLWRGGRFRHSRFFVTPRGVVRPRGI